MLHKITIENFYSIAEEQVISLSVPRNVEGKPCFKDAPGDERVKLPSVVAFFGANASGKTTVMRSVPSAALFALSSFANPSLIDIFRPYKQGQWRDKPTKISIEFDWRPADDGSCEKYCYAIHISAAEKVVLFESLSHAPKGRRRYVFRREAQQFDFAQELGVLGKNDVRKAAIRSNASVISTLAALNHPFFQSLCQFINELLFPNEFLTRDNLTNDIHSNEYQRNVLSFYDQDSDCLKGLNKELRRLDVGLENMKVEKTSQGPVAKFKHVGLDEDIDFMEESEGTKRFISIFPEIYFALRCGRVVIIDEIDKHFHPLILPELFRWFSDPQKNAHKAQLFFTAHNATLLDYLEKEQIFFVEKLHGKPSEVYRASDIKGLRRGPSLMKKYLMGELGAIPNIG